MREAQPLESNREFRLEVDHLDGGALKPPLEVDDFCRQNEVLEHGRSRVAGPHETPQ